MRRAIVNQDLADGEHERAPDDLHEEEERNREPDAWTVCGVRRGGARGHDSEEGDEEVDEGEGEEGEEAEGWDHADAGYNSRVDAELE